MPTLTPGTVTRNKTSQTTRRRPEQRSSGRNTKQHHVTKHQNLHPPEFWNRLSHIPLSKNALRELDRRNTLQFPLPNQNLESQLPQEADIKRFSRCGGPDLQDLRGFSQNHAQSPSPPKSQSRDRVHHSMPRHELPISKTPGGGVLASKNILGKRGKDRTVDQEEQEEPPARKRGRGRPRGRGSGRSAGPGATGRETRDVSRQQNVLAVTNAADRGAMSTPTTTITTTTIRSQKTGPYTPEFRQHLIDHNVLPLDFGRASARKAPGNIKEIKEAIERERPSDPMINFDTFEDLARSSIAEAAAVALLERYLQPDLDALRQKHFIVRNQLFTRLDPLTDVTITKSKPDLAYGAEASDLASPVRDQLGEVILPTPLGDIVCPNFMVAAKGSRGDDFVMNIQAVHDGAVAARGMHALWSFGEDDKDVGANSGNTSNTNVARSLTCTWKMGTLKMYATYRQDDDRVQKSGTRGPSTSSLAFPTYVTYFLGIWNMMEKEGDLKLGVAAYRNGMDWAQKQRDEAITRANRRVRREVASASPEENEPHRSRETEHNQHQLEETAVDRVQVHENASEEDERSDADEVEDFQDVNHSFKSIDSQQTITQTTLDRQLRGSRRLNTK